MEQNQTASPTNSAGVSSFMSRATDIFTAPGDVYGEVATAPVQTSSWLTPMMISMVVVVLFTVALFNNQSLRQQILEPQRQEMQKNVDAGKMSQAQMDTAVGYMESPVWFMAFGIIMSVLIVTFSMFGIPLVLWLAAKWILKYSGGYKKMLEVFGLSSLIGILGAIVTLLLMHVFDSTHASPGAGLLVMNNFDRNNFVHKFLSTLSIFTLWQTGVVGIGLGKISGKSVGTGVGVAFGLWAVWAILSSIFGWGMR